MKNIIQKSTKRNVTSILITGNFGFLGKAVCKRLLEAGYDVVNKVSLVDVTQLETLKTEFSGVEVDYIYHLAGKSEVTYAEQNPIATLHTNVAGTWNVMELARELNVKCVFVASTQRLCSENNLSIYDASKLCSESVAKSYHHTFGVPVIICRFGIIFGEGDSSQSRLIPSVIRSLIANDICSLKSPAGTRRKYIYLEDAVSALIYLLNDVSSYNLCVGKEIEICYPSSFSIKYIVESLVAASGKKHLSPNFVESKVSLGGEVSVKNICDIGWSPEFTMENSLIKTYRWYEENT